MKNTETFKFGKHKGETLEHVARTDGQYINWCLNNICGFSVPNDLVIVQKQQKRRSYGTNPFWRAVDLGESETWDESQTCPW